MGKGDRMVDITRRQLLLGVVAMAASRIVGAQDLSYPRKPIRWIVPFPAGGGNDWITRFITDRLGSVLGQPVVVDNRPGAASTIGLNLLAKSAPDGYTVATGDLGGIAMTPHMTRMPFDPLKDLQPVSLMIKSPWLWVVNPNSVPVDSFREFINLARKSPGKYSYASFGTGSLTHVMTELFASLAGIRLLHVPYKGGAPALQDVMAGQIHATLTDYNTYKALVPTGRVRALACTTRSRLTQLPDLPTFEESGVPKYNVPSWIGAVVPAGTPPQIVTRLQNAIGTVLASPEVVREFSERAIIRSPSTPAQFEQEIKEGFATWGAVIKAANITVE